MEYGALQQPEIRDRVYDGDFGDRRQSTSNGRSVGHSRSQRHPTRQFRLAQETAVARWAFGRSILEYGATPLGGLLRTRGVMDLGKVSHIIF